jgi:hypothetical protein
VLPALVLGRFQLDTDDVNRGRGEQAQAVVVAYESGLVVPRA